MQRISRRGFCALGASAGLGVMAHEVWGQGSGNHDPAGDYFRNPILPGDHPDPSAIRVGDDYYLTHSSFVYTPGLVVWHSRNLVDWEPVSAALLRYMGDVWAPFLCQHGSRFFIYFPLDGKIFAVQAESPHGPWSEPVDLRVRGIDPAHLAMPDRRRYLYLAGGRIVELAADGLSVKGEPRKVFDAWPIPQDWRVQCECLEAPKVIVKDGYIYLNVAEGGTSGPPTSHMVISARSRNPEGPWEYSPYNPIVHTRSTADYWWSVGHGRLVEATDGSWWMTVHAYQNGYRSLGRQNLLLPVEWTKDGWFRAAVELENNPLLRRPPGSKVTRQEVSDNFAGENLGLGWQFFRGYDPGRFRTGEDQLILNAQGRSLAETSVMTCIAGDTSYTVEVDVEISPGCEAGLLLFYNGEHAVGLFLNGAGIGGLRNGSNTRLGVAATRVTLRLVNDEQQVDMYYRLPGGPWSHAQISADVTSLNESAFRGFLDLRPALFACGSGQAHFRSFLYYPDAYDPMQRA